MKIGMRRISAITLMALMAISIASSYAAVPIAPHAFFGEVTIGEDPASDGTTVEARIGGIPYATTTTVDGKYGYEPTFKVPADDTDTGEVEGGVDGDTVMFYVAGVWAANHTFQSGEITELNLSIEAPINEPPVADANGPYDGTEGVPVNFDASASYDPDGTIVSYEWDFGDESTGTGVSQNHTYAADGIYTANLTVTDDDGATDWNTTTADIADVDPVADFSATPLSGDEPLTVSFTDLSTSYDGITSWSWDFGDGETSTEQSPIHEYVQEGSYPVTLTVSEDDGDFDTDSMLITVEDTEPDPYFEAMPLSGDEPLTVEFTDLSTSYDGIVSWFWDFGDGEYSTLQNPSHTYVDEGVYNVSLTVVEEDEDAWILTWFNLITVSDTEPVADFSATPLSGDEPLTVSFTDLSTSYDGITSWSWDFGDGETSTEQSPIHEYVQDDVYTVTLTVTEADGDFDAEVKADYITVSDTEPVAAFTVDISEGMEPLTVNFTDLSTSYDGIVSWLWEFGDGENSTLQNPTHEYIQDNVYNVTLTVSEADGDNDTETKVNYITVSDTEPIADFEAEPLSGDEPITVEFYDLSDSYDGIVSWFWDFGDGVSGYPEQHPNHQYLQEGNYTVTLIVTDSDGSTAQATEVITVSDTEPVAAFTVDQSEGPEPLTVTFTDASTAYDTPMTYSWNFGDESALSTEQSPVHEYLQEGNYTITLIVTDSDGSTDEATYMITVEDTEPYPDFSATPLSGPEPLTVVFTDLSTSYDGIVSYFWEFGDGENSTLENPSHIYVDEGVYNVSLTVVEEDEDAWILTWFNLITVSDTEPVADFTAEPLSGDEPLTVVFTDLTESYDEMEYWFWDFGDGENSTLENPSHIYVQEGVYTVSLTVTEADGDFDAEVKADLITVSDTEPAAEFEATPLSGVEPLTVNFTDLSTSYDGVSYLWEFGDGENSTLENPSHIYVDEGVYNVTLTVSEEDGDSDTEIKVDYITVSDTDPVAGFSATPLSGNEPLTMSFTDLSTSYDGITSWSWNFGDGETSTEQSPVHEYLQEGVYNVSLTVSEADEDSDIETKVGYITVTDIDPEADFEAAPLIGDEPLTVEFADLSESYDGIVSWLWDFGDGSALSEEQSPVHEYLQEGVYNVSLTVSEADEDSDIETKVGYITVTDIDPEADFEASPLTGNETLTVNFTSLSTSYDGITYFWDFGDGETGTLENVTHAYVEEGLYTVSLTVYEADGDEDTETKTGYIIVTPIEVEDSKEEEVAGGETDYVVNATAEANTTVTLNTTATTTVTVIKYAENPHPDVSVPEASLPKYVDVVISNPDAVEWPIRVEVSYTDDEVAGIYEDGLGLYYWNSSAWNRCSDTGVDTENNIVWAEMTEEEASGSPILPGSNEPPVADADGPYLGTEGVPVTFNASASYDPDGTLVSYEWEFGDGELGSGLIVNYTYAQDGSYDITLTVTDDEGAMDSVDTTAEIADVEPVAGFSATPLSGGEPLTVEFTDKSTSWDGIVSWFWEFGDGENSTEQSPIHNYVWKGTYTVSLNVSEADGDSSTETKAGYIEVEYTPTTYDISLEDDWNLISLPLIPNNSSIDSVLSSIAEEVDIVWTYDAEIGEWLYYEPITGMGDLEDMVDGAGYWMNMTASATLTVYGVELVPGPVAPPAYPVVEGWNLIGFKETDSMSAEDYLSSLSGKYSRIYGYNTFTRSFYSLWDVDLMQPGQGYWIYVTEEGFIAP